MILTLADLEARLARRVAQGGDAARSASAVQGVLRESVRLWCCKRCGSGAMICVLLAADGISIRCGFESCAPLLRIVGGACPTCAALTFRCACESDCYRRPPPGLFLGCSACGDVFVGDAYGDGVLRVHAAEETILGEPLQRQLAEMRAHVQSVARCKGRSA